LKQPNILCAGKGVGPSKVEKMEIKIEQGKDACILKEGEILELLGMN